MLRAEITLPARGTGLCVRPRRGPAATSSAPATPAPAYGFTPAFSAAFAFASAAGAFSPNASGTAPDGAAASDAHEVLLFFGDSLHTLEGGEGCRPLKLGPPVRLYDASPRGGDAVGLAAAGGLAALGGLAAVGGLAPPPGRPPMALQRLVSLAAGAPSECDGVDGVGSSARFGYIRAMCADGQGALYVAESMGIRKLVVGGCTADYGPGVGREGGGGGGPATGREAVGAQHGQHAVVHVSTLPGSAPPRDRWHAMVYDADLDCLIAATDTAIYRVPLPPPPPPPPPPSPVPPPPPRPLVRNGEAPPGFDEAYDINDGDGADGEDDFDDLADEHQLAEAAPPLRLLAGHPGFRGSADGIGGDARFFNISAMALVRAPGGGGGGGGGSGLGAPTLLVVDGEQLRRVDIITCHVSSVHTGSPLPDESSVFAVLPNGSLALAGSSHGPPTLTALGAGYVSTAAGSAVGAGLGAAAAAAAVGGGDSLRRPLGHVTAEMLLSCRQDGAVGREDRVARDYRDSGSSVVAAKMAAAAKHAPSRPRPPPAIVEVIVGDTVLAAHRSVLAASSEYFRGLFAVADRLRGADGGYGHGSAAGGGGGGSGASGRGLVEDTSAAVELKEADPDATAALLAAAYTGVLDVPPPLLRAAAELAGRLLMTEACEALQLRLLTEAEAEAPSGLAAVVEDLTWAERHSLVRLAAGLAAMLVRRRRQLAAAPGAAEALRRLAEASPSLAADLVVRLAGAV
ncbi:hypothetical protein HYH03_011805 [Edaphochlamys debaryana]|uniref:BTB domain-containing protein n=1 Tax=Edaphochlamys debaryana TaxID=47281 RepID=A0A835XWL6_9CHLO|nr:hypothetical protein HYH03_011805 [Edaphochlamys debaryana]|eukprot:KAG2489696.1 hypothetical protein HYH03_011805 [Edaphochlamys debaryana]